MGFASGFLLAIVPVLAACLGEPAPIVEPVELVCPDDPPRLVPVTAPAACDVPRDIDIDAVDDLTSYRAAASALVCDTALQCFGPWVLAESYCHPGFAEREAMISGASRVAYDPERGRACLTALAHSSSCLEALDIAFACRDLSLGAAGAPCTGSSDCGSSFEVCDDGECVWRGEGEACDGACGPGLTCLRGTCQRASGCTCENDFDCGDDMGCHDGVCRLGMVGEACGYYLSCRDGLVCESGRCVAAALPGEACVDRDCAVGNCLDGVCVAHHHLGCGCERDDDCPHDVARCVGGECVARPMPGEACDPLGAPCFGSGCYDGTCQPLRQGDGPCSRRADCAVGLDCSAEWFGTGRCGAPLSLGDPCGPDEPGRCGPDLYCPTATPRVCAPAAAVGQSCAERPCVDGAVCDADQVCVDA